MCGRYVRSFSPRVFAERFNATGNRGLIPFWAKDPKIGYRMINARAETVASKPAYRKAFCQRRCLVASDGVYQWKTRESGEQPYLIRLKDSEPFAFAGLWEHWEGDD